MTKRVRMYMEMKGLRRKARRLTKELSKRFHVPGPKTSEWLATEDELAITLKYITRLRNQWACR